MTDRLFKRREKIKTCFEEEGIDALLLSKRENQAYISGLDSADMTLLLTKREQYIMTDSRYTEAAGDLCPDFQIVELKKGYELSDFLGELSLSFIGFEQDVLTVAEHRRLTEGLSLTKIGLKGVSGLVEGIRSVKDEDEIDAIGRAAALGDRCFTHMLSFFKEGITEREAALEIEWFFKKNGAQRLSFDTICIFGSHTSLPHGIPGNAPLKKGDLITMDFGCVLDGYCSDMTRTVAFGSITEEQKRVYEIVLEAQLAALDGLSAGISYRDGDAFARNVIEKAGFGHCFGHGTGHGVGLEIHEAPTLSPKGQGVLQENMVVTVEPGIYLPKKFGIRIEDLAIVTSFGIINKVYSKKELIILS